MQSRQNPKLFEGRVYVCNMGNRIAISLILKKSQFRIRSHQKITYRSKVVINKVLVYMEELPR